MGGRRVEELLAQRDEFVRRLRDGQQKIMAARKQGRDPRVIEGAEKKWLGLLRDYEKIEEQLRILRAEKNTRSQR